jgi:hypothetical protein
MGECGLTASLIINTTSRDLNIVFFLSSAKYAIRLTRTMANPPTNNPVNGD